MRKRYGPVSYMINQQMDGTTLLPQNNVRCPAGRKLSSLEYPSDLVLLFCCPGSYAYFGENVWVCATKDWQNMVFSWGFIPSPMYGGDDVSRVNYLFCDGHAANLNWLKVYPTRSWLTE